MQVQHVDPVTGTAGGAAVHTELGQHACISHDPPTHATRVSEVSRLINEYEGSTLFIGPFHSNFTIIYRSDAIAACTWQASVADFGHPTITE